MGRKLGWSRHADLDFGIFPNERMVGRCEVERESNSRRKVRYRRWEVEPQVFQPGNLTPPRSQRMHCVSKQEAVELS